jgi:hypothetical protein
MPPGRQQKFATIALVLIGVLTLAGWYWQKTRSREPVYGNKTLSQLLYDDSPDFVWIPNDLYGHIHDELWGEIIAAPTERSFKREEWRIMQPEVRTNETYRIGTNAIPWLIRWMEAEPTRWDKLLDWVVPRLPVALSSRLFRYHGLVWGERYTRCHIAAFQGFTELGTNAEPALPALSNRLWNAKVDLPLTWAVANIGPQGIVLLTNMLMSTNAQLRDSAALALGLSYEEAREALPALVTCVERWQAGYHVLGAMGRIGGDYPPLVPALVSLLEATNPPPKAELDESMAALVLGLQGDRARAAVPALLSRYHAAQAAGSDNSRRLLRRVLKKISPGTEDQLPPPSPDETGDNWP